MITYLFRMIAGALVGFMVQSLARRLMDATGPPRVTRTDSPPPRAPRIHIDRNNIMDADFEDILERKRPDRERR
jgi:hypothetical protein